MFGSSKFLKIYYNFAHFLQFCPKVPPYVREHDKRRNGGKMRTEDTTWINFRAVTIPISLDIPGLRFNNLLEIPDSAI